MQLLNCIGPYLNEPLATLFQTEDAAKELFGPAGCCLQLVISTSSTTCTLLNKVTARGAEHLKQKTPFTLKGFQLKDSFHSKAFHLEEPFHSESLSPEKPL